ncbi:hypothetical protein Tco_0643036 [Tanacetum coccineum]
MLTTTAKNAAYVWEGRGRHSKQVYLQRLTARLVGDAPATEGDVDIQDELEEVPLLRKTVRFIDVQDRVHTLGLCAVSCSSVSDVLLHADISEFPGPSVDSNAREEKAECARLVQQLQAEDFAQADVPLRYKSCMARELLGADVNEDNFIERMTAIKERKKRALADLRYRALKGKPLKQSEVTKMMRNLVKNQWCAAHNGTITMKAVTAMSKQQLTERKREYLADVMDKGFSFLLVLLLGSGFAVLILAGGSLDNTGTASSVMRTMKIGAGVVVCPNTDDESVDPGVNIRGCGSDTSLWDRPVDDFLSSESESDDDIEDYIPPIPYGAFKDWEIVRCPLRNTYYHVYYQDNRRHKNFFYLKELLPHVYREDLLLLRRRMNRYFRLNPDVDVGLDLWRDVNLLCQSLHSDDVEEFWRTQDDWVVYPIRAPLLERMLHHRLTVPPSYCRDVVVAGSVIQTIQDGLRESYECLASAPIACTARQMVFNSPWLTAEKEFGSPLQTALVCNSNPLLEIEAYLKDDSISLEIDHADCDPEGDICLIEKLLNNDSFQLPSMDLKQGEIIKAHAFREKQHQPKDIQELLHKLLKDLQIIREEPAEYINSPSWNYPAFYDDDDEYTIQYKEYLQNSSNAIIPDLPTEEPDNSLSMGDEHLSTIPETDSDELIKSSVEDLVPIPSESEGISDDTCDVPFCDNSPPLDVLNDHFEIFSDFNDDDDSFEDIDYVEASPPDSELVSLGEAKDDILHEKLLNSNILIDKIESLNDNPTPDCVLKSPSPFPIPVKDSDSFFEKSDTSLSYSDNSLPEFKTFSDHTKETRSGSTTTHADNYLTEYDSFHFEIEPDQGELSRVVMETILGEPRIHVPNVLPTHTTLYQD